jgi:hypothetical protein
MSVILRAWGQAVEKEIARVSVRHGDLMMARVKARNGMQTLTVRHGRK